MKKTILLAALAAAFCGAARGAPGLAVSATLPFVDYLVDEPVALSITVKNTGEAIYIADDYPPHDRNRVLIHARDPQGRLMQPKKGASLPLECSLRHGESVELQADARSWFDFKHEGRYSISVEARRGDEGAFSRILPLTLVPGISIKTERRVAANGAETEYQLLYWPRNEREHLFIRIKDTASGAAKGFAALGQVVRISEPRIEFQDGSVFVTHQTDRNKYARTELIPGAGGAFLTVNSEPMTSVIDLRAQEANRRAMEKIAELEDARRNGKEPKPFVRPPKAPPKGSQALGPVKKPAD